MSPSASPPTAPSPRWFRRQLLKRNRLLGLPHPLLGGILGAGLAALLVVGGREGLSDWWLLPGCWALAWAGVELLFLRRRLAIRRLAMTLSRNEVARQAMRHGVALSEVAITDHPDPEAHQDAF